MPRSNRWSTAGVDILLPETAIDTLNLKACLFAIQDFFDAGGRRVPVMVSGTFDKWWAHVRQWAKCGGVRHLAFAFPQCSPIGMNCALGPDVMRPHMSRR